MNGMFSEWLADVGGQIAASVSIAVLGGIAGMFTPWGKRLAAKAAAGIARAWWTVRSIRVTTRPRIEAEIADAVRTATADDDEENDDGEPRRLRPEEYEGWVLGPASEPRHWELRNQTGESVTVEGIIPAGPFWPFEWEEPDFPAQLAPGESLLIRARRVRSGNSMMPWMDDAMANVIYEDDHGDEREDVIWILQ